MVMERCAVQKQCDRRISVASQDKVRANGPFFRCEKEKDRNLAALRKVYSKLLIPWDYLEHASRKSA